MKIDARLDFDEKTLEHPWRTYNIFDDRELLIGRLYLRANFEGPEQIELYRKEQNNE